MITDMDCGPDKVLVDGMCVSANPEEKLAARGPGQAGRSGTEYYRQYLQDLPQYQTREQGDYTGMGTSAFHPLYGKSRSNSVLSTPLQTDPSNLNLTGILDYAGKTPFSGVPGYAGGHSGYDATDVMHGYRVRETPKRIDAPFSMGDPYAQGGSLWNVGRMMGSRVDPYAGIPPTLLYDLRRAAAGGAEIPPGYSAGPGRTTPSEGWPSVESLLKAAGVGSAKGTSSPAKGSGLLNVGDLLGGGAPIGGVGGGRGKGSTTPNKKGASSSGGGSKSSSRSRGSYRPKGSGASSGTGGS